MTALSIKLLKCINISEFTELDPYVLSQDINDGFWNLDDSKLESILETGEDFVNTNPISYFLMHEPNFVNILNDP